jgi:Rps23 Pro-64 3,4-dihydroxylase Tpa1-like proline 4-hydroxylase
VNRAILPPYLVVPGFLEVADADALLDFALARETDFGPTGVSDSGDGGVDRTVRVSESTRDLGRFRPVLVNRLRERLTELTARLRVASIAEPRFELELVAHNHGAFYKRHIDTRTGSDRSFVRIVSAVYYVHARPRGFSGGSLRLFAFGDPQLATFVDIAPDHNSLLVFPSWAQHEVLPVSCPSGLFAASRFAVNCWVYGNKRG